MCLLQCPFTADLSVALITARTSSELKASAEFPCLVHLSPFPLAVLLIPVYTEGCIGEHHWDSIRLATCPAPLQVQSDSLPLSLCFHPAVSHDLLCNVTWHALQ